MKAQLIDGKRISAEIKAEAESSPTKTTAKQGVIPFAFNAAASSAASALISAEIRLPSISCAFIFLTPFFLEETYHISVIVNVDIQRRLYRCSAGRCYDNARSA